MLPQSIIFSFYPIAEYKGHCLLDACRQADLSRVKKCLTSETINFIHPYTGETPLHAIAQSLYPKRKQVIEMLIRKGALLNEKNKDFLTPFHIASDNSFFDIMETLLSAGANLNALDGLGQTALHRCAQNDNVNVVRLLLSHSADTSIVSLQGFTALQLAGENVLKLFQGIYDSNTTLRKTLVFNSPTVGTPFNFLSNFVNREILLKKFTRSIYNL